jgi:hypothetical protein
MSRPATPPWQVSRPAVAESLAAAVAPLLPEWLGDVSVRPGPVPASLEGATAEGVLWSAAPGRFRLQVPGVGSYLAAAGSELIVDAIPGAAPAEVARFARMTPLVALCYQRGIVAWHAATAVRDGEAVILAGDSAAGKSTLLTALWARGWGMLGDEVAPVTVDDGGRVSVLPTGGEIRLWPDALERLGLSAEPSLTGAGGVPRHPTPIRSIWRLALHNYGATEIATEEGFDRFDAVGKLVYHARIAHALLDRGSYLKTAAAVASRIPHYLVRRPRGEWTVTELAGMIDRDCGKSGR